MIALGYETTVSQLSTWPSAPRQPWLPPRRSRPARESSQHIADARLEVERT
jgi:hypothetical protein